MSEIEPINETHSDRSDNNDRRDRSAERAAAAAEAMRTAERARAVAGGGTSDAEWAPGLRPNARVRSA